MKSFLRCVVLVGLSSLGAQAATSVPLGAPKKIVESWRVAYDYDVHLDFTRARGLAFEVFCENALAFSGISLYLKTGDGFQKLLLSAAGNARNTEHLAFFKCGFQCHRHFGYELCYRPCCHCQRT